MDEEMNKENAAPVDSNTSVGSASSMAAHNEGFLGGGGGGSESGSSKEASVARSSVTNQKSKS